ncbi:MAG: hypothetical protein OXB95_01715 [Rhodobacteraceae bacterium]|nr:hypothetical protein [Paracoccaceae bacterium]
MKLIVEIKSVIQGGINLGDAPHVFVPWLEPVLGKPPLQDHVHEALVVHRPNRFVAQRFKRAVGMIGRRLRADCCRYRYSEINMDRQGRFVAGKNSGCSR